jgi:hypothetical protein
MFPTLVEVVGTVRTNPGCQSLAENADTAFTCGYHFLAGATTHHMHYVQRAIDLSMQNIELICDVSWIYWIDQEQNSCRRKIHESKI